MTTTPRAGAETALSEGLADGLVQAAGMLRRQLRRAAGRPWPAGDTTAALTTSHGELIRVVRRAPGVSIAEAATELGLAANTVSTLVAQLVVRELVERTPDPADRRVARLALTPAAERLVADWRDRRVSITAAALARLTDTDRDALTAALPALERLGDLLRTEAS